MVFILVVSGKTRVAPLISALLQWDNSTLMGPNQRSGVDGSVCTLVMDPIGCGHQQWELRNTRLQLVTENWVRTWKSLHEESVAQSA